MNEENPSTDATFDRLLDELHGIQSGQSYAAALEWTSRLRAGLDALESLAVRDAVLNAHLSKTEIASALGITRQTLYNRHKGTVRRAEGAMPPQIPASHRFDRIPDTRRTDHTRQGEGMTDRVEIERRCGMIMGARHGHMTLTWLPDRGRHGTRTWVLATHDGDTVRRIRLNANELGELAGILQAIANEGEQH